MKYLLNRIAGTEKYKVNCSSPSRICGRLMSEYPGAVYGAKVENSDSFCFYCIKPYSQKVIGFLENYDCNVKRISRFGFPSFVSHLIARPGLILGLIIALVTLLYCNGIVWDVEISGNDRIGDTEIEQILASAGFASGKRYDSEDLPSVCNRFIIMDNRFTRIAINMSGNKAFVEVTERTKKTSVDTSISDSGIVSQYDCIVERPEVVRGTALVKKGDVVEKGTMLISPVEKGNEGNEYISGAKGKIFAKTQESFSVTIPFQTVRGVQEERIIREYLLTFLGASAKFSSLYREMPKMYRCSIRKEKAKIGEDYILPFKMQIKEKKSFKTEIHELSAEEAEKKAYEIMYSKISRDLKECEILSTEFETITEDDKLTLLCRAECLRDVVKR